MQKILFFILFLWSGANVLCTSDFENANNNNGPVSNMMESLAEHTASVSNELLAELLTKTESTTKTLMSNMETVITSALNKLSQPLEDFQKKISSSQCQPLATLGQLNHQIDADFSKCTQDFHEILNTFQQDTNKFKVAFEKNIEAIMDLPKKCKTGDSGADFSSQVNCYIGNIAGFNQQIANVVKEASETLAQVRQLAKNALQESRTCTDNVITNAKDSLKKILDSCPLTVEQF